MDTIPLRDAFRTLLDASPLDAATATAEPAPTPPAGEWNADQILAHVAIVSAATISTVSAITAGTPATYDNRVSMDLWTLGNIIDVAGGSEGLRERIRAHGEVLCVLAGSALSETELSTPVPTRLVSGDTILVDRPIALRDIISGLAEVELPGHTAQLRALAPAGATV